MVRLFSHKKFLDMLRLHSKTILKLNASVVLFTLMLLIAVINDINAYPDFVDETCHTGREGRQLDAINVMMKDGNILIYSLGCPYPLYKDCIMCISLSCR